MKNQNPWFSVFISWFLVFCFSASTPLVAVANEETPSEQFDPTNLLMPYLTEPAQKDVNITSVPMQIAKLQHKKLVQSQTIDTTAVNFAAQIDKELAQNSLPVTESQSSFLKHQLWRSNMTVPKAPQEDTAQNELQSIIDQIRSVEFELKSKTAQPVIVVEPLPQTEPNEILPIAATPEDTEQSEQTEQSQIKPELPYEPVSDETLQIIEDLSQHLDQLDNPFELAEVLFYSGHLKDAVMCYRQALARIGLDKDDSTHNKPWILFQIANCLRSDDPITAAKIYRQLIAEHPESAWADVAKAREQLLLWYRQDDPKTLIEENQP